MTRTSGGTLRRRLPVLTAVVPAVILLPAASAAAGQLVEVTGDFAADGSDAAVTLEYVVTAGDAPVETIPVTGLHFGDATLGAIEAATADGQPMQVEAGPGFAEHDRRARPAGTHPTGRGAAFHAVVRGGTGRQRTRRRDGRDRDPGPRRAVGAR